VDDSPGSFHWLKITLMAKNNHSKQGKNGFLLEAEIKIKL
jgi:hypothetical protein